MSRRVFVDSDVILDVLADRKPHSQHARRLFSMMDKGQVLGHTSPIIFANLFYLLRKQNGLKTAKDLLTKLKILFNVLPMDGKTVDLALASEMSDFEDALQYHCAEAAGMEIILTRNARDYRGGAIPHSTPEEFLSSLA